LSWRVSICLWTDLTKFKSRLNSSCMSFFITCWFESLSFEKSLKFLVDKNPLLLVTVSENTVADSPASYNCQSTLSSRSASCLRIYLLAKS
jgi:hypothetical protein